MKKLFFLLIAGAYSLSAVAQQTETVKRKVRYHHDSLLSNWVIDVNLLGGGLTQKYTTASTAGNYYNGLNVTTGNLKFTNGASYGFDAQLGYFFGRSKHFGVGIGFSYLAQSGTATLDTFHTEYQATDPKGRTYRQLVTADQPIQEKLNITNLNIPVLLKYKTRFSKHFGFMIDAGAMINLQVTNAYKTNAAFDYEAIYQYNDFGVPVYDYSPTPANNDFLITKAHFIANNPDGNVAAYFAQQSAAALGNNVGLGVKPASNSGNVSFTSGSIGFLVRPAFNYYFSDMVALTVGGYYLYQPFKSSAQSGYELTNGTITNGTVNYSSPLHTVTSAPAQSYGVNLGVRIYLTRPKDVDKDGVPDRIDRCPTVFGLEQYDGCPDTDGDGIADPDDSCPTVAGLAQFNGCPDTDGDGIPDKDDMCPTVRGLAQFHGCPDTDGDGIPDKDDMCPTVPGLAQFHGCPDTDGDGVPDNEDKCPTVAGPASNGGCPVSVVDTTTPKPAPSKMISEDLTKPILFETDKTIVHKSAIPTIEEAAKMAKEDPNAAIVIDGYADSRGPASLNKRLSLERAMAVKAKLRKLGVSAKHIKIRAHGSKAPVASNKTKAGRHKNRRAVMHLKAIHK